MLRILVTSMTTLSKDLNSTDYLNQGFLDGSEGKESACNAGDLGLTPGSERSPGEGNVYSLQYSCLENSMEGGA